MAHADVNWVLNSAVFPDAVKPSARWLLIHVADRINKETGACFPSHKLLAKDTGMTPRSVLSLLDTLEEHGFIKRTPQFRENGTRSTDLIFLLRGENSSQQAPQSLQKGGEKVAAHNQGIEPGKEDVDAREVDPFEAWWEVYPRKVAKAGAQKAFWTALSKFKCDTPLTAMIEATRRFAEEVSDRPVGKIPHAATWLNGERWNDEPDANRSQTDDRRTLPTSPDRGAERHARNLGAMQLGAAEAANGRGGRRWRL